MAFLDFTGLSHFTTKLKSVFIKKEDVLETSDIDDMFSGDYSSQGLKVADDKVVEYLVERIKYLETHSILDSNE